MKQLSQVKTPCQTFSASYQLQFSIDSAKGFGNQLPNTTLGIILAYSLVQSRYFSWRSVWCITRMCLHRKAGSLGTAGRERKRAWGETNPSLHLIRCNNSLEETRWFQQQPVSTSRQKCHTTHPVPQDTAHHRVTLKLGNTDRGVLHLNDTTPHLQRCLPVYWGNHLLGGSRYPPFSNSKKPLLVYVTLQTWGCFERSPKHTRSVWAIQENKPEFQLYIVSLQQSSIRYHKGVNSGWVSVMDEREFVSWDTIRELPELHPATAS